MRKRWFDQNPVILSLPVLIARRHNVDKNFFRLITVEASELHFYDIAVGDNASAFELPTRVHCQCLVARNTTTPSTKIPKAISTEPKAKVWLLSVERSCLVSPVATVRPSPVSSLEVRRSIFSLVALADSAVLASLLFAISFCVRSAAASAAGVCQAELVYQVLV